MIGVAGRDGARGPAADRALVRAVPGRPRLRADQARPRPPGAGGAVLVSIGASLRRRGGGPDAPVARRRRAARRRWGPSTSTSPGTRTRSSGMLREARGRRRHGLRPPVRGGQRRGPYPAFAVVRPPRPGGTLVVAVGPALEPVLDATADADLGVAYVATGAPVPDARDRGARRGRHRARRAVHGRHQRRRDPVRTAPAPALPRRPRSRAAPLRHRCRPPPRARPGRRRNRRARWSRSPPDGVSAPARGYCSRRCDVPLAGR